MNTLATLGFRVPARVASLQAGELGTSLMELGLVPGTRVEVIRQAPWGDPLEIDVAGARLALRRSVAATVFVERL